MDDMININVKKISLCAIIIFFGFTIFQAQNKIDTISYVDLLSSAESESTYLPSLGISGILLSIDISSSNPYSVEFVQPKSKPVNFKFNDKKQQNTELNGKKWNFEKFINFEFEINDSVTSILSIKENPLVNSAKKSSIPCMLRIDNYIIIRPHSNVNNGSVSFKFGLVDDCSSANYADNIYSIYSGSNASIEFINQDFSCLAPGEYLLRSWVRQPLITGEYFKVDGETPFTLTRRSNSYTIPTYSGPTSKACLDNEKTISDPYDPTDPNASYRIRVRSPNGNTIFNQIATRFTFTKSLAPGTYEIETTKVGCSSFRSSKDFIINSSNCCSVAPIVSVSPAGNSISSAYHSNDFCPSSDQLKITLNIQKPQEVIGISWSKRNFDDSDFQNFNGANTLTFTESGIYRYSVKNHCGTTFKDYHAYVCCSAPQLSRPNNEGVYFCPDTDSNPTIGFSPNVPDGEIYSIRWTFTPEAGSLRQLSEQGSYIAQAELGEYEYTVSNGCGSISKKITVLRPDECITNDPTDPVFEATAELCQDGLDNDSDGLIDCDDIDCYPFFVCEESVECVVLEVIDNEAVEINRLMIGLELQHSENTFDEKLTNLGATREEFFKMMSNYSEINLELEQNIYGEQITEFVNINTSRLNVEQEEWKSIIKTLMPLTDKTKLNNPIDYLANVDIEDGECEVKIYRKKDCIIELSVENEVCNGRILSYNITVEGGILPIQLVYGVIPKGQNSVKQWADVQIRSDAERIQSFPYVGDDNKGLYLQARQKSDSNCSSDAVLTDLAVSPFSNDCISIESPSQSFSVADVIDLSCFDGLVDPCITFIDKVTGNIYNEISHLTFSRDWDFKVIISDFGQVILETEVTFSIDCDGDGIEFESATIDKDGDGKTDAEDSQNLFKAELCENGLDDDGDGLIDCQDYDCYSFYYDSGGNLRQEVLLKKSVDELCFVGCPFSNSEYLDNYKETTLSFGGPRSASSLLPAFYKMVDYILQYQDCITEGWESYDSKGIMPYCMWDEATNNDPYMFGVFDGVYSEIKELYDLISDADKVNEAACLLYGASYNAIPSYYGQNNSGENVELDCNNIDPCLLELCLVELETEMCQISGTATCAELDVLGDEVNNIECIISGCEAREDLNELIAAIRVFLNNEEELGQIKDVFQIEFEKYLALFDVEDLRQKNIVKYKTGKTLSFLSTALFKIGRIGKSAKLKKLSALTRNLDADGIREIFSLVQYQNRGVLRLGDEFVPQIVENHTHFYPANCVNLKNGEFSLKRNCDVFARLINGIFYIQKPEALKMFYAEGIKNLVKLDFPSVNCGNRKLCFTKEMIDKFALKLNLTSVPGGSTAKLRSDFPGNSGRSVEDLVAFVTGGNDRLGEATEELMDIVFSQNGYKKILTQFNGNKGFDGVYVKTKGGCSNPLTDDCEILDLIIGEAKQKSISANPLMDEIISLTPSSRAGADQMTDEWIVAVRDAMRINSNPDIRHSEQILAKFIESKNYDGTWNKVVVAVDKSDGELNILKF